MFCSFLFSATLLLRLISLSASGIDSRSWTSIDKRAAHFLISEVPFWDFNTSCVQNRRVHFTGRGATKFTKAQIKAWNTAIMFTIENGVAPSFIGEDTCH